MTVRHWDIRHITSVRLLLLQAFTARDVCGETGVTAMRHRDTRRRCATAAYRRASSSDILIVTTLVTCTERRRAVTIRVSGAPHWHRGWHRGVLVPTRTGCAPTMCTKLPRLSRPVTVSYSFSSNAVCNKLSSVLWKLWLTVRVSSSSFWKWVVLLQALKKWVMYPLCQQQKMGSLQWQQNSF